jgi:RNase P protein component
MNRKTALLVESMLPLSLMLDGDRFKSGRICTRVPDLPYERPDLTVQNEIKSAAERKREKRRLRNLAKEDESR